MNNWELRPRAERDLVQIWHYSDDEWGRAQADQYVSAIFDRCEAIARGDYILPETNRIFGEIFKLRSGSHNIIFRRVRDRVIVLRILHERMDIRRHLS
ncbi:MAG: hypothetical protein RL367_949 [Pseudomonadota bacterium]|jgi:toxin ParE1/3/4